MGMFGQSKLNAKPTASLSSTLLARKGQAKPAMRPQGFGGFGTLPAGEPDDLGWNDMGDSPEPLVPAVLVQRDALREEFAEPEPEIEAEPEIETAPVFEEAAPIFELNPVSLATATRIGRDTKKMHGKRHPKAAFTLRLDEERHLRLRLASALQHASAQALVTAALDHFLQSLPEVEELVRQIPARTTR